MTRFHLLPLCLVVTLFAHRISAAWNAALRNHILKIHNDYRKAVPGACGMKTMTYDQQLENEAKHWAKRCVFDHEMKSRGENIAWYTQFGTEKSLVTKMASMWHGEVKDFTYGQKSCGKACHYTQMVWSDSTHVGCYAHHCDQLQKGGSNALFLVCFYSPQGNYIGQNPYKASCGAGGNAGSNGNTPGGDDWGRDGWGGDGWGGDGWD